MRSRMSMSDRAVYFARSLRGRFRGVYQRIQAAEAAVPANRLAGYDHAEAGMIYAGNMSKPRDSDYPVLYWLSRILNEQRSSVFDCGGNIGVTYYKFANYLD